METFVKKHPRRPLELQLTAMIDIFSMIVIFLILGSIFGAAEVVFPPDLSLPKSVSKEGIESAPRIVIQGQKVTTSLSQDIVDLKTFRELSLNGDSSLKNLKKEIHTHLKKGTTETKASGAMLNVIADTETPYQDVFDVIHFFREQGFETLLFVATGEGKSP